MRKTFSDRIFELAKQNEKVIYIGSDLDPLTLKRMREEIPSQGFMEGISEQHIMGMAAGLALEGFIPFVHNIAAFATRRCYEQIALDVCLHNLPVRIVGNGGGVVYAPLGPTHLAVDDFALMRALPNMTVLAPCDRDEMSRLMAKVVDYPGPIYIRMGTGYHHDPVVSQEDLGFEIGQPIMLRHGRFPLLISTGVMTWRALEAAKILADMNIQAGVLHVHTLKPLKMPSYLEKYYRLIVTIEEHSVIGGLGDAVSEVFGFDSLRLGLPDKFISTYGTQSEVLDSFNLTPQGIVDQIRDYFW